MKGELDWIKVNVNSFDDNKIRIISSMPQGDSIICIWFRLLFEAGKNNDEGYIYINEFIPYTYEMLGKIFNRSAKKVQYAIDTLKKFMMIEVDSNNFIKIKNWNKYQSVDKLEAIRESGKERTRRCRAKKKAEVEAEKLHQAQEHSHNSEDLCLDYKDKVIDLGNDYHEEYKYNSIKSNSSNYEFKANNEISHHDSHVSHNYDFEDPGLEVAVDNEIINKGNILRELEESEYSKELRYENSNIRCNVTCNNGNVTVTDKIKNKKEIQTIDREKEKDRNVDKETNANLNLSSNATQNVNERYTVTHNEVLEKREDSIADNMLCYSNTNVENSESNVFKNVSSKNSYKGIDQIIEEIQKKNNYDKHSSIDIAYVMHVFYANYTENEEWLTVDDICWMLIEHDWKYVKTAIEIVIAAGTFELRYVNRLLTKWKESGYPKAV